jgi:hypothetical protein
VISITPQLLSVLLSNINAREQGNRLAIGKPLKGKAPELGVVLSSDENEH